MKRLILSAALIASSMTALAYPVDLLVMADHGNSVTAHGVNRSNLYLRCNLIESGVNAYGPYSNVIGVWDFAPMQTREFHFPKNGSYFNFHCP